MNATNGAVGNTGFYFQSARSINKTIGCSAAKARIVPCPIRSIRVIRSLMTRDCALRGRVQGRVIETVFVYRPVRGVRVIWRLIG